MHTRTVVLTGVATGVLLAAGALAATQLPKRSEGAATASASASASTSAPAPAAGIATVEARDVADVYAADAVIEAVRAATVSAQISGNVTGYYVDAGDRVRRGQLLVRIDTRDTEAQVAAGAAAVAQAEAQLKQAQLNYERTAKLVEQRFVSPSAFDKADADLKSAQAALQMARAGVTRSVTARSFAELRAPLDGVVTRRLAELEELASPGSL